MAKDSKLKNAGVSGYNKPKRTPNHKTKSHVVVAKKGVKHYKRDGTEHKGSSHKMPNGDLHTNKSHTKTSVKLFHFKDLSKKAKVKAKK